MTRHDRRNAAMLPTTRFSGRRWSVAMRDPDWDRFVERPCRDARMRLTVVLERFCDHGERDLPRGAFRWLTPSERSGGASREATFEAWGTVLRCHATDRVMFVDAIGIDPPPEPSRRGAARRGGSDQRQLPLLLSVGSEEVDG